MQKFTIEINAEQALLLQTALNNLDINAYIKHNHIECESDMLTSLSDMFEDMLNNNHAKDFDVFSFVA
jgi:hypothetical protein